MSSNAPSNQTAGSPAVFAQMLQLIGTSFADPGPIEADFQVLYPGRDWRDPDFIGAGATLHELYLANVEGFATEVLENKGGRFYELKGISRSVTKYMVRFDVKPNGPDLLKYTLGFGLCFDAYMTQQAERTIIRMLGRMRTIRLMNATSALARTDGKPPPDVMVRKLLNVWKDLDGREELVGKYGTYLTFKTWSLG